MAGRFEQALQRVDHAELRVCRCLNRSTGIRAISTLFRVVSRLGDGWVWYALIASTPLIYGSRGWEPAFQMVAAGAGSLLIYKSIKNHASRERPFVTHDVIQCVSAPLDRYSFPSGHTLHAVAFTVVMSSHFAEWGASLTALTSLIALSRVVLGLHYPTDVAAGALLGGSIGMIVVRIGA